MQDWAIRHCPFYLEPVLLGAYTLVFFLLCGPPRRAVQRNLGVLIPGSAPWANFFRAFRVFWNFSWSLTDSARARFERGAIDWEIEGLANFRAIADAEGGAIVATAHMGSYDLAAPVFAGKFNRKVNAVRAPEREASLQKYAHSKRAENESDAFSIRYNAPGNMLGIELAQCLSRNEIVAIQADRILFDVAAAESALHGHRFPVPKGPFALASATGVPIHPFFVLRTGWRSYKIVVGEPIDCRREKSDTDREAGIRRGVAAWTAALGRVLDGHWHQWFVFEPAFGRKP